MACFSVPLATAAVATAVGSALPESARGNPFASRIGWLGKMMFGGSLLLAVEHVYHGELSPVPPFLTAIGDGNASAMLQEMATRGVAMAVAVGVAWAAAVVAHAWLGDVRRAAGAVPCGA